ncbi:hypothetical protein N7468_010472 [Penicillium chermesinum]|uniref:Man(5)GlcNAc(2)-PP-dolichol translocation protein RFT1 n=1 Tax=Penicillium chermesinum TaxID=63820 RepID=A0A9W9N992_9EURO|nr:uncharacterized protein N7468_010472 [Penicillium chermesinum]KAJ5214793.1 hypothetical protein N7468_010472 [Penicillium chermesinum]
MSHANPSSVGEVLASSASGTKFLILIQLASRVFTFASNQLILRALSPVVLGAAAQLELYQVSILYFSRESIRLAIQRQPLLSGSVPGDSSVHDGPKKNQDPATTPAIASQSVVNISYLSILLGFPSVLVFTLLYQHFAAEQTQAVPFFGISVGITGLAVLLELSIEPCFAIVQQQLWYDKRATAEVPAALLKSITTCMSFMYLSRRGYNAGTLPFALGFLSYSATLIGGYWWSLLRRGNERSFSFLLTKLSPRGNPDYLFGLFSRQLMTVAASVFFQSLVKHLLTQGDSMMLAALSTLEDQGIYSLAANYGGLLARIVFQPLEESSRNLFSMLLNPDDSGQRKRNQIRLAKVHLVDVLQAYELLSILLFPIGPVMVPHVLHIIGGQRWASSKIGAFYRSTVITSPAYLFLEVGAMGAYGLVLANIVNMVVRTLWSYLFIKSYLEKQGDGLSLREVAVRPVTFALVAIATATQATMDFPDLFSKMIPSTAISVAYTLLM